MPNKTYGTYTISSISDGIVYSLNVSHAAIVKGVDGTYNPTSITLTAKSQTGTAAMQNYSGRFKIETTTNGTTWVTDPGYTSSGNEASHSFTIPTNKNIIAVRCSLYASGGTTTLLDQQVIPIVNDGENGNDAYTVILTNENHTFSADHNGKPVAPKSATCGVIAYKGATQIAASIGAITCPTGMSYTKSPTSGSSKTASFTVTVDDTLTTKNGTLTIPVTADGKTFNKVFTYTVTPDGPPGVSATGLGVKVNASTFTKSDNGECYYHGFDDNNKAADVNGWVNWNGRQVTIPKGYGINPDQTMPYNTVIYSVYRLTSATADTGKFHDVCWIESSKGWFANTYSAVSTAPSARAAWTWNEATDIILAMYVEPSSEGAITNFQLFTPPKKYSELTEQINSKADAAGTAAANAGDAAAKAQSDIDNLEIGGRNLFINADAVGGYIHSNASTIVSPSEPSWPVTSDFFPITGGKQCIIQGWFPSNSGTTNIPMFFCAFYSDKDMDTAVSGRRSKEGVAGDTYLSHTTTAPDDAAYMRVTYRTFGYEDNKIKVEVGTKPTDWTQAPEDVQNNIDSIQIGGRNLLLWTENMPIATDNGVLDKSGVGGWQSLYPTATDDGVKMTYTSTAMQCIAFPLANNGSVASDENVILSFTARGKLKQSGAMYWTQASGANISFSDWSSDVHDSLSETEWKKFSIKLPTANANVRTCTKLILFYASTASTFNANDWIELKKGSVKLEIGTRPTDWSPAPEEVKSNIDNIQVGVRNYVREEAINPTYCPRYTYLGVNFEYEGNGWWHVSGTYTGGSATNFTMYGTTSDTINITEAGTYTASYEYENLPIDDNDKMMVRVTYYDSSSTLRYGWMGSESGTKYNPSITYNCTRTTRFGIWIGTAIKNVAIDGRIRVKVESGTRATGWIAALEDAEYSDGRNLLMGTGGRHESFTADSPSIYTKYFHFSEYGVSLLTGNTTDYFTLSFDYEMYDTVQPTDGNTSVRMTHQVNGTMGEAQWITDILPGSTGHYSSTFKLNEAQATSNMNVGVRLRANLADSGSFSFTNLKMERGVLDTKWSAAPEDQRYSNQSGENLLRGTGEKNQYDKWVFIRAGQIDDGVIRLTPTASNGYAKGLIDYLKYGDYKDHFYTLSFDAKIFNTALYANEVPNLLASTAGAYKTATVPSTISAADTEYWQFTTAGKSALTNNTTDYITVSFDYQVRNATPISGYNKVNIYAQMNGGQIGTANEWVWASPNENGHFSYTAKLTADNAKTPNLRFRIRYASEGASVTIMHPKVTIGTKDTPWVPSSEDDAYTTYTGMPTRILTIPMVTSKENLFKIANHDSNTDRYSALSVPLVQDYDWHRYSVTINYPLDLMSGQASALIDNNIMSFELAAPGGYCPIDVKGVKLERGLNATDWSISYADLANNIQGQIDSIGIGGRNLLKELDIPTTPSTAGGFTCEYVGSGWFHFYGTYTSSNNSVFKLYGLDDSAVLATDGDQYTLSIENDGVLTVGQSGASGLRIQVRRRKVDDDDIVLDYYDASKSSYTFSVHEISTIKIHCTAANMKNKTVDGRIRVKLEKGNKPTTDWTPAPEDVESDLAKTKNDLNTKIDELVASEQAYRDTVTERVSTLEDFAIGEEQAQMIFNNQITTSEVIKTLQGDVLSTKTDTQTIYKYITFADGSIALSTDQAGAISLLIQNDRISFQQNGTEVAYISDRKLYITEAEILANSDKQGSLTLGNFAFIPQTNGSLSFKKVK